MHNLIARIHSAPAPKADKLETVVEFALAVRNLCATIEACQLHEYAYNVALLQELVEKLPTSFKVDWAKYRRAAVNVGLITFSEWLYDLAEAVSPIAALHCSDFRGAKGGKKGPTFLNAHSEQVGKNSIESTVTDPAHQQEKTCKICGGSCLAVEKCRSFAELGYNARWEAVKKFQLCRKCLTKHKGACKSQKICGKNSCTFKHHPLLHNDARVDGPKAGPS